MREIIFLDEGLVGTGVAGKREVTKLKYADGSPVNDLESAKASGDLLVNDKGEKYVFSPNGSLVPVKGSDTKGIDYKFIKKKDS